MAEPQLTLRPYQSECLLAIREAYAVGVNRQLVSLPTGCGKTVIFAHLPQALGLSRRVLVLAHREELLEQAAEKLLAANPGVRVGIEQAGRRADPEADIVLASVPSIGRSASGRIGKFKPQDFGLIICDEAHHAVASTYRNIFDHFGLSTGGERPLNPDLLLVGFTATPRRGDQIGLEEVFDEIVFHRDIKEMIRAGYLCPLTGYRIYTETDLSGVHTRMGDFVSHELSGAVNHAHRNALVVKSYSQRVPSRRAIVFAVDVAHAHALAEGFRDSKIPCAAITGEMAEGQRREALAAFRQGSLRVLTNCQVLTEGFDQPDIEAILLARPTTSSLLYTQMIGRGTRPAPGKERLVVIDIVDNSRRHALISLATLFGLPARFDLQGCDLLGAGQAIEKACEEYPGMNFEAATSLSALQLMVEEIDLMAEVAFPEEVERHSRLAWFRLPDGSYKLSLGREYATLRENLLGQYEITLGNLRLSQKPHELGAAFALADRFVEQARPEAVPILLRRVRWRAERATEKQIELLRRLGIPFSEEITKGEAAVKISRYFAARSG